MLYCLHLYAFSLKKLPSAILFFPWRKKNVSQLWCYLDWFGRLRIINLTNPLRVWGLEMKYVIFGPPGVFSAKCFNEGKHLVLLFQIAWKNQRCFVNYQFIFSFFNKKIKKKRTLCYNPAFEKTIFDFFMFLERLFLGVFQTFRH